MLSQKVPAIASAALKQKALKDRAKGVGESPTVNQIGLSSCFYLWVGVNRLSFLAPPSGRMIKKMSDKGVT